MPGTVANPHWRAEDRSSEQARAVVVEDHFPQYSLEVEGADIKAPGVSPRWSEEAGEQHWGSGDQTSAQPWRIQAQGQRGAGEAGATVAEAGRRYTLLEECCSWTWLTVLTWGLALLRAWLGFGSGGEPVCCI